MPPPGWRTTGSAIPGCCRGSGSGLRFSSVWGWLLANGRRDGGCCQPPLGSEHLPDGHVVWGGVVAFPDRLYDLRVGSLRQDALDGDLFCPLVRSARQEVAGERVGVGTVEEVFDHAQHAAIGLPALVDLLGVGVGVGHGVPLFELMPV